MIQVRQFSPISILKHFVDWRLRLKCDHFEIVVDGDCSTVDYLAIEEVAIRGIFFRDLLIRAQGHKPFVLKWSNFVSHDKEGFLSSGKVKSALVKQIQVRAERTFYEANEDHYIADQDFRGWWSSLSQGCGKFLDEASIRKRLAERNENFILREDKRFRKFFESVENSPLTDEQRRAAIVMEDNNLLVAAAGSGKTSAIVGKVGYLLKKGYCNPSEILVLAFNKAAANEMEERIGQRLGDIAEGVAVKTFHKFGRDIIAGAEQGKLSVAKWTVNLGENTEASKKWEEMIASVADKDRSFNKDLSGLFTHFRWAMKPIHLFKSKSEYEQYLRAFREKRRSGANRGNQGVLTINGEYVRSLEEVAIANWLYVNGVEYEYEKEYEHDTADSRYSQYKPDFYYPKIDVYHEHFALDENGKALSFFGSDYEKGVQWKRDIHARYNTRLIETNSAMFVRGDIFDRLKTQLQSHGIEFGKRRTFSEITKKLGKQYVRPLYSIMRTFLTHWKSSGMSESEISRRADDLPSYESIRAELFVRIMIRVRREYDEILRKSNEIDFEDMLCRAEKHLRHEHDCGLLPYKLPYKMILVDEFQDVSRSRARLLKAMLDQTPGCKLFAVGDDWQSIYRFAGADISVMTDYAGVFGTTATNYLRKTFRFNQGIADVAAAFVSRNPSQLPKEVMAHDAIVSRVILVANYDSDQDALAFIERQLQKISDSGQRAKVYILARYRFHKPTSLEKWQQQFGSKLNIEFSTIHSAKGQEADHVFVLGMNAGKHGFPSEIEDDPVLQLVQPKPEKFQYAEERRLFYVALTRARHKVYLLTEKGNRSSFVSEILADNQENVHECNIEEGDKLEKAISLPECPKCGGSLKERKGPYSRFFGCSNYPKCKYIHRDR